MVLVARHRPVRVVGKGQALTNQLPRADRFRRPDQINGAGSAQRFGGRHRPVHVARIELLRDGGHQPDHGVGRSRLDGGQNRSGIEDVRLHRVRAGEGGSWSAPRQHRHVVAFGDE